MSIWSAEIKELEKLYESIKGQLPVLEKELGQLIHTTDANVIMLYSRRCLEVIITELCECDLKRDRGTEPLKGVIDKLNKDKKIPAHIASSMYGLNELSTYGAHPKDFDPEQVKPVLINLDIIIKWYLKYKDSKINITGKSEEIKDETLVSDAPTEKKQKSKKKFILLISGGALIVIVVLALSVFDIIGGGKPIKKLEKSIAVLPFRNESVDQENSAFVNGLMEKILNNLQLIKDFRVISRTSVEQYRDQNKAIPEIAKELKVNYIVEGSAQKYGSAFSLSVQLIKADKKEDHLWGKSFEQEIREVDDILNIQTKIAEAIAKELEANITIEEKQLINKAPTTSLTANDLYQKGREAQWKFWLKGNDEDQKIAEDFYKEALKYDPEFSHAYTGLGWIYLNTNYWKEYFSDSFLDSVLTLTNTALSFDPQSSEAYVLKGIYYYQNGNIDSALEEYYRALEFNPNDWQAYWGLSQAYFFTDLVKCIENFHKAASINRGSFLPSLLRQTGSCFANAGFLEIATRYHMDALKLDMDSATFYNSLGSIEESKNNYKTALELHLKAYSVDSINMTAIENLGWIYSWLGLYQESIKYYKKFVNILESQSNPYLGGMHRIGYAYRNTGLKKEADYYFDKEIENQTFVSNFQRAGTTILYQYYDLAGVYAFRGDRQKAYDNLRKFNQRKIEHFWMANLIKKDPLFDSIRNEPEFQQIVRDVEAKYEAEHERVRKWLEEQGML